jgi:hypothetical protein
MKIAPLTRVALQTRPRAASVRNAAHTTTASRRVGNSTSVEGQTQPFGDVRVMSAFPDRGLNVHVAALPFRAKRRHSRAQTERPPCGGPFYLPLVLCLGALPMPMSRWQHLAPFSTVVSVVAVANLKIVATRVSSRQPAVYAIASRWDGPRSA